MNIDVTDQVDTGPVDDECMSLCKCVCGAKFEYWTMIISIYENDPTECPHCKRKLFFSHSVRVYQVISPTDPTNDIVRQFWSLSASQRRKICGDLGILPKDESLSETQRYEWAFLKAKDADKVDQLIEEIRKAAGTV